MDYKKKLTYEEKVLVKTLHWGEWNALTQNELSSITGFTNRRIKYLVNSLRRNHCPVMSNSSGYYLSDELGDYRTTINLLSSQIRTLLDTRDSIEEIISSYPRYVDEFKSFLKED